MSSSSPTPIASGGDGGDEDGAGLKRKWGGVKEADRFGDNSSGGTADGRRRPSDVEGEESHENDGEKRKRKRAGGEEAEGLEGGDTGDDSRGPGLKLTLMRKGDGGWSSKRDDSEEDKGREGVVAEERDESGKRQKVSPAPSPPGSRRDSEKERSPVPLGPDGKPLEVLPGKGEVLAKEPEVVRQRVGKAHESVDAAVAVDKAVAAGVAADKSGAPRIENISQGQLVPPPGGEGEQPGATGGRGASGPAAPSASTFRADVHRIPAHAGWFHWKNIHSIEMHALPEFFNGRSPSKTPEFYKQYRDFIINRYRENPQRLLTFTEVRRMLVGDVNALRRVFEFLDHWGLINYQASADSRTQPPLWAGAPALLVESSNGSLQLSSASVSLASTVYQSKPSRPQAAKPPEDEATKALSTRKNVLAVAASDSAVKSALLGTATRTVEYHCNACGADCSQHRYHCQKQADFDLCPACFADGKYGAGVATADFIRMDALPGHVDAGTEEWSDQETLLLLEALEIYGDNWTEIAEHVATKSKAQCMLHFVRLPIEDPFLENMEKRTFSIEAPPAPTEDSSPAVAGVKPAPAEGEAKKPPPPLTDTVTPFADAGNPVMAQVAFLASMVGPHVAAVSAQSALAALTDESPMSRHAVKEGLMLHMKAGNNTGAATTEGDAKGGQPERPSGGDNGREEAREDSKKEGGADDKDGQQREDNGQGPVSASEAAAKIKEEGGEDSRTTKAHEPLTSVQVRAAAATALAAAAVKAKLLADKEEGEIQRLVCNVIELQLKKLDIKLRHFDNLEDMLERERGGIERARQQLYTDRMHLANSRGVTAPRPRNAPPGPSTASGAAQIRPPVQNRPPPPSSATHNPQADMRPAGSTPFSTGGAPAHTTLGGAEGSVPASRPAPGGAGAAAYGVNSAASAQQRVGGGGNASMGGAEG